MESIAAHAESTRSSYQSVLRRLEEFCAECYESRTPDDIVKELKSIPLEDRDDAYYGLLQDYVNWLLKRHLSNKTVNNHFNVIKHYFSYYGIRTDPTALRQNVNKPKEIKEKLHPLALEEIHKIFARSPDLRRMLYLVLIGSGMRIRECVALRKRDFDLRHPRRIRIDIPAQYTKTKTAHTTFVSREASKYLVPRLKSLGSYDLVFATNPDPYHASMTEIEAFTRYRDAAGLTSKYESANRHHITLHSFRSYFFTRARRVHDTDIAHAMVGHSTYLDMYDRKDDSEKLDLYLKVEPKLRISFSGPSRDKEEKQLNSLHPKFRLNTSMDNYASIRDVTDFNQRMASQIGFILLTDRKKGNKWHRPTCCWLKLSNFREKVIKNAGKNGSYYWCGESGCDNAILQFQKCKTCFA